MLSAFEIFTVGVGPSSSHTVGPMRAANRFVEELPAADLEQVRLVVVEAYGSLAATGAGHRTPEAMILGLGGLTPESATPERVEAALHRFEQTDRVEPTGARTGFTVDLRFLPSQRLPGHVNGLRLQACTATGQVLADRVFYSVGGGFVVAEGESDRREPRRVPYPFVSAAELLEVARTNGLSVGEVVLANESAHRTDVEPALLGIWAVMSDCLERGLTTEGTLPGGLEVTRRAPALARSLSQRSAPDPLAGADWLAAYAMAVNEENAAGGQVVTAPTNGAAGVVPAVLRYYLEHMPGATPRAIPRFLLAATAIGILCKSNASISGAEVGCQGEIGSATAMAAAGLAEVLGGSPAQVENAAEIALEHNLGLTCDPVAGLVQLPCIERNAVGAVKAVTAARLALAGDGSHRISLDVVIETMRQTGAHMRDEYKETARGGLAVNVVDC